MKSRIVQRPRLAHWQVTLFIRQVDAFLDATQRRREFNRKRYALLSKRMEF